MSKTKKFLLIFACCCLGISAIGFLISASKNGKNIIIKNANKEDVGSHNFENGVIVLYFWSRTSYKSTDGLDQIKGFMKKFGNDVNIIPVHIGGNIAGIKDSYWSRELDFEPYFIEEPKENLPVTYVLNNRRVKKRFRGRAYFEDERFLSLLKKLINQESWDYNTFPSDYLPEMDHPSYSY